MSTKFNLRESNNSNLSISISNLSILITSTVQHSHGDYQMD